MLPIAAKMNEILDTLEEEDFKMAISYIQYLSFERQKKREEKENNEYSVQGYVDQMVESLVGILPDDGRTLDDYREERLKKYEVVG